MLTTQISYLQIAAWIHVVQVFQHLYFWTGCLPVSTNIFHYFNCYMHSSPWKVSKEQQTGSIIVKYPQPQSSLILIKETQEDQRSWRIMSWIRGIDLSMLHSTKTVFIKKEVILIFPFSSTYSICFINDFSVLLSHLK